MNFIKKLLNLFKSPDPRKPVEFPVVVEKECCGKCEPAKKKPVPKKKVAAKGVVAAKKTAAKKKAK